MDEIENPQSYLVHELVLFYICRFEMKGMIIALLLGIYDMSSTVSDILQIFLIKHFFSISFIGKGI